MGIIPGRFYGKRADVNRYFINCKNLRALIYMYVLVLKLWHSFGVLKIMLSNLMVTCYNDAIIYLRKPQSGGVNYVIGWMITWTENKIEK